MTYLVTGCAGFIGSQICERLLSQNQSVIGIDSFTDYYARQQKLNNLAFVRNQPGFQFIEGDLVTLNLPEILQSIDCVFHTAGQPGVRGSWGTQFDVYLHNNIHATQQLLEAIKQLQRNIRVVYSSSSSVYGNTNQLPTSETALPRPYSPYGTTKLAAEHLCHLYHDNYGIPVVSLRYFTVYGPRQRPDMAFHRFCKAILHGQPITVLGDGNQTRDFTYVDDIVTANLDAATKPVEGGIYNLGGGSRVSVNQVLGMLARIAQKEPIVEYKQPTKGDVRDTSADTARARQELGYSPSTSLEEGLKRQFDWVSETYAASSTAD